jgi:hypothetical protein
MTPQITRPATTAMQRRRIFLKFSSRKVSMDEVVGSGAEADWG